MSKPITWAGWSSSLTYNKDGGMTAKHAFHGSIKKKNCIWIDMPEVDQASVTTYTFYKMPPNTNRSGAKRYLWGLTQDKDVKVMLQSPEIRSPGGGRPKKTLTEQQERLRLANANMKAALEE